MAKATTGCAASGASSTPAIVGIVDDDDSVRESVPDLLTVLGFSARAFSSAEEFLLFAQPATIGCLLLDVFMPGMSGPELHAELIRQRCRIPVIFITAETNDRLHQQLLARGAVACLTKPFSEEQLRAALDLALRRT